jgi:hypothetical protein
LRSKRIRLSVLKRLESEIENPSYSHSIRNKIIFVSGSDFEIRDLDFNLIYSAKRPKDSIKEIYLLYPTEKDTLEMLEELKKIDLGVSDSLLTIIRDYI